MAHDDAREGKWRGNWRKEWVASTLTPPPKVVYPALLKLIRTPQLPAIDWTDAPTDLNGLVRFEERWNLVSARVPSRSARAITMKTFFLHKCPSKLYSFTSCLINSQFVFHFHYTVNNNGRQYFFSYFFLSESSYLSEHINIILLLVFSPWASLGRNQSPVRWPVWLWYAASWASS